MEERKAIVMLKAYLKCKEKQISGVNTDCNNNMCDNCDLCYAQGTNGEHKECVEVAINALEKQIPKKLKVRKATNNDIESELRDFITTQGKICECPTCKDIICVSGIEYCWYCGQKLDWSDKNETD